jgi:hypothetical protein
LEVINEFFSQKFKINILDMRMRIISKFDSILIRVIIEIILNRKIESIILSIIKTLLKEKFQNKKKMNFKIKNQTFLDMV